MKCDKLKPLKNIQIAFNTTTQQEQVIAEYRDGYCHGFDEWEEVYLKDEVDTAIAELKNENERLKKLSSCAFSDDCLRVRHLKRKVDTLLGCLKYLVMRDLIKDCPSKKTATEIVKEYDNGLG